MRILPRIKTRISENEPRGSITDPNNEADGNESRSLTAIEVEGGGGSSSLRSRRKTSTITPFSEGVHREPDGSDRSPKTSRSSTPPSNAPIPRGLLNLTQSTQTGDVIIDIGDDEDGARTTQKPKYTNSILSLINWILGKEKGEDPCWRIIASAAVLFVAGFIGVFKCWPMFMKYHEDIWNNIGFALICGAVLFSTGTLGMACCCYKKGEEDEEGDNLKTGYLIGIWVYIAVTVFFKAGYTWIPINGPPENNRPPTAIQGFYGLSGFGFRVELKP